MHTVHNWALIYRKESTTEIQILVTHEVRKRRDHLQKSEAKEGSTMESFNC
jgi:hypothetical protein